MRFEQLPQISLTNEETNTWNNFTDILDNVTSQMPRNSQIQREFESVLTEVNSLLKWIK